LLLKTNIYI